MYQHCLVIPFNLCLISFITMYRFLCYLYLLIRLLFLLFNNPLHFPLCLQSKPYYLSFLSKPKEETISACSVSCNKERLHL